MQPVTGTATRLPPINPSVLAPHFPAGERVSTHGMILMGRDDAMTMSHIPMFMRHHDVQALWRFQIQDGSTGSPLTDKAPDFSSATYTFEPKPASLNDLVGFFLREDGASALPFLSGTIYRGNFEDKANSAPVPGFENVRLVATSLIYAAPLNTQPDTADPLSYFLWGSGDETYLVHEVTGKPGFDQIIKVKLSGTDIDSRDLAAGLKITFPQNQNGTKNRLHPGAEIAVTLPSGERAGIVLENELSLLQGPNFTPDAGHQHHDGH